MIILGKLPFLFHDVKKFISSTILVYADSQNYSPGKGSLAMIRSGTLTAWTILLSTKAPHKKTTIFKIYPGSHEREMIER